MPNSSDTSLNDVIIRPATEADDAAAIAKLLYLTDPYIYPYLCDNYDDAMWVDFVGRAMKIENHPHAAKNMMLATCNGVVVGLLCAYPLSPQKVFLLPVDDSVKDKYARVAEGYYNHADAHKDGLYISNLCIDPAFRRAGIGVALLNAFLNKHPRESVALDVLADNISAVALYKRAGFETVDIYNGFSGASGNNVRCLSMLKPSAQN